MIQNAQFDATHRLRHQSEREFATRQANAPDSSGKQFPVTGRHHPVRPIEMASRGFAGALRFLPRINAEDVLRHLLIAGIGNGAERRDIFG
ncbi:hypothetical protein [Mesorhizobium sp.]|uniref:hypothetical protein n=1 Tax=Mesorhizobium sp. TaxID=1871066 RepID=UPI000FE4D235|nr:hypothetical protein [Mesorhizobium sp.]RWK47471.1 MAG: hypothetical protein EOR48_32085 [Mesorhizobium sp.]